MKKHFFVLFILTAPLISHGNPLRHPLVNGRDETSGFTKNLSAAGNDSTIILSEIMFAPQPGNNEFIELFNTSYTESVDLKDFGLKYYTSNTDVITSAGAGTILKPRSFAIVFEGDYDIENGIYKNLLPATALAVKISDNVFGSSGMANTISRTIQLLNPSGKKLEEYIYSADNTNGISDEKIFLSSDFSQSNWANTKTTNGTPGFKNSVTPKDYDLGIIRFKTKKSYEVLGNEAGFEIVIKNYGVKASKDFLLKIYLDADKDSAADESELLKSAQGFSLQPGDSLIDQFSTADFSEGKNLFIAKIETTEDESLQNNTALYELAGIKINEARGDIVINEIMYTPDPPQPEWIEIYNNSIKTINLKGYKIADASDTLIVINDSTPLYPGEFFLFSSDSTLGNFFVITSGLVSGSLPVLNNSGDKIILLDSLDRVIDSLEYSPAWGGNNGRSLERIFYNNSSSESSNWKTSISPGKATPGEKNSVVPKSNDLGIFYFKPLNSYGITGTIQSFEIRISNFGINKSNDFSVDIFKDADRDSVPQLSEKIFSLNEPAITPGDTLKIQFEISNFDEGKNYFIAKILNAGDENYANDIAVTEFTGVKLNESRNDIVINEIMYKPGPPEPEWIELYNNSSKTINFSGYKISDESDTNRIISAELILKPDEFLIISTDSTIENFYPYRFKFVAGNLPTLNNYGDRIILLDSLNRVIDSLEYSPAWGGNDGRSLERISADQSSDDSANWGSSKYLLNGTPGKINSISQKAYDVKVSDIIFNPASPLRGENVTISASIKNTGKNSASFSVYLFEDTNNDSLSGFKLDSLVNKTLPPGDSSLFIFNYKISNILSSHTFIVKAVYDSDQDRSDNFMIKSISAGYHKNDLVINEIMYDPEKDQPEWIEVYNNSQKNINLKSWSVINLSPGQQKYLFGNSDYIIGPGNFLALAPDSSFLNYYPDARSKSLIINFGTLNNSGDGIAIYDFAGTLIDSLFYTSGWGGEKGFSLERISYSKNSSDSTNWRTSLSKSTPGLENSALNILSYNKNSVVVNEIMFDPSPQNSEFIELYNTTDSSINIGGWTISDEAGSEIKISPVNKLLNAASFFALAADSSILKNYNLADHSKINISNTSSLGLSNSQDLIILKDAAGSTIDSVQYFEKWHNQNFVITQNKSLERINPFLNGNYANNWSTSTDAAGATPGLQNSIYTKSVNSNSSITVSPNPFSPDNDGFEDFTIIHYSLRQKISQLNVKIFDSRGRLVRTLENNMASGSEGSVIFDGLDDNKNRLRIGIYIALIEAVNRETGVTENMKAAIVVAKKI